MPRKPSYRNRMIELGFSFGLSEKQKSQHAEAFVAAFEKIAFQTTISGNIIDHLCETGTNLFVNGAARSGKVYYDILSGHTWDWPALEYWSNEFSKRGLWPETWRLYPQLADNTILNNPSVAILAESMLAADLKNTLLKLNVVVPKKITKKDMVKTAISELNVDQLISVSPEFYESLCAKNRQKFECWRCDLLATTIALHAYQLIHYSQGKDFEQNDFPGSKHRWIACSTTRCPIELEFAEKWNNGEINTLPPFFPGDRTHVRYTKLDYSSSP